MKFERDEQITWYLLTLIYVSAFLLFLYVLIEQAYSTDVHLTLLSRLLPGCSV